LIDVAAGLYRPSFVAAKAAKNALTFIRGTSMAEKLVAAVKSPRHLHVDLQNFTASLRKSRAIRKAMAADFDRFAQVSTLDVFECTATLTQSVSQWILDVEEHTSIDSTGSAFSQKPGNKNATSRLGVERFVMPVKVDQLVKRMVDYARQFQQTGATRGEDTCLGVLRLLRRCLVLQRRVLRKVSQQSYHAQHHSIIVAQAEWTELQANFTDYGVAKLVVDVVSHSRSRDLVQEALQLGRALAFGGTVVQEDVFEYLKETRSEPFFDEIEKCIKAEVSRLNQWLPVAIAAMTAKEAKRVAFQDTDSDDSDAGDLQHEQEGTETRRNTSKIRRGSSSRQGSSRRGSWNNGADTGIGAAAPANATGHADGDGDADDADADDADADIDGAAEASSADGGETHVQAIMQFLHHLCENHYAGMQRAVRDQSAHNGASNVEAASLSLGNQRTTNLLKSSVQLVVCMAKKEQLLDLLDKGAVQVLICIFRFLIECAQGPCFENQAELVSSDLAECCKSIFTASFVAVHEELGPIKGTAIMEQLQANAMKVLMSLTEGSHLHNTRTGSTVYKVLEGKLETSLLRQRLIESYDKVLAMQEDARGDPEHTGRAQSAAKQQPRRNAHVRPSDQKREERVLGEVRDMLALVEQLGAHSPTFIDEMTPLWKRKSRTRADAADGVNTGRAAERAAKLEHQNGDLKHLQAEEEGYSDAHRYFDERLEHVEIVWKGHLERLLFVKPRLMVLHTKYDKHQCIDALDFTSTSRFKSFVQMANEKKRELELTQTIKNTNRFFKFIAHHFHFLPYLTYFLAVAINLALVLAASFPEDQRNSWIHDSSTGERYWNHNNKTLKGGKTDPIYGKPYYGTDEGSYDSNGDYSGPTTLVKGAELRQDSTTGQRATVYNWSKGIDGEALIFSLGIVHLLLQITGLLFKFSSCAQIVYEDMNKGKSTSQSERTGSRAPLEAKYNHHDQRLPELLYEHFRGVAVAVLFGGCWLLQLMGRYGGLVPLPFLWANILLAPGVAVSTNSLFLKWEPWIKFPLPQPALEPEQQNSRSQWLLHVVTHEHFALDAMLAALAYLYCLAMQVLLYPGNLQFVVSTALAALAVGGYPFCYSILTLLVVNTSKYMQTVLHALSPETRAMLASTMLLLVLVIYIFSSFAFFYLNGDLYSGVDGSECDSLLDCALTLFHSELLSGGDMAGKYAESWEEDDANPNGLLFNGWDRAAAVSGQFITVFVFEVAFYLIALIVLLNMVFGIIIDRFAELRDIKRENDRQKRNTCFVCGFTKDFIDADGLKKEEHDAFEKHVRAEHDMWRYFSLQIYILTKKQTEFTGAESFLYTCLRNDDNVEWAPHLQALRFESANNEKEKEEKAREQEEQDKKAQAESSALAAKKMDQVLEQVGNMQRAMDDKDIAMKAMAEQLASVATQVHKQHEYVVTGRLKQRLTELKRDVQAARAKRAGGVAVPADGAAQRAAAAAVYKPQPLELNEVRLPDSIGAALHNCADLIRQHAKPLLVHQDDPSSVNQDANLTSATAMAKLLMGLGFKIVPAERLPLDRAQGFEGAEVPGYLEDAVELMSFNQHGRCATEPNGLPVAI
jgi:hypothetical protein